MFDVIKETRSDGSTLHMQSEICDIYLMDVFDAHHRCLCTKKCPYFENCLFTKIRVCVSLAFPLISHEFISKETQFCKDLQFTLTGMYLYGEICAYKISKFSQKSDFLYTEIRVCTCFSVHTCNMFWWTEIQMCVSLSLHRNCRYPHVCKSHLPISIAVVGFQKSKFTWIPGFQTLQIFICNYKYMFTSVCMGLSFPHILQISMFMSPGVHEY